MDRLENGPAFAHLSVLVDIAPDLKDIIKHKFITCLCRYVIVLFYTTFNVCSIKIWNYIKTFTIHFRLSVIYKRLRTTAL